MSLAPGTRLGPYEVLEPLASGGMGEVHRARDPRLGREVAVKLLSAQGAPSPDRRRRFETEARAVASLSHPNVVTIFDVGTHEGVPYLVLELLEGHTLREVLQRQTPPLRQAVSWALDVARGLAAAHERGIVHRDLKPDNVFLTVDGRLKVLDFGLARHREPTARALPGGRPTATETRPGQILGTAGYMAPEQVRGEVPDARTDVFALGAVLYEMVTKRRPFSRASDGEILAAVLRDEPAPPSSLNAAVPAALEAVIHRCLAKEPTRRFASAREVAAALETALAALEPSRPAPVRAAEPRGPYPGLASFTEADAARFFGRETEVESLWRKLRQGRLRALIGPSGAGKTSLVRAGLIPSRPSGWGAVVVTPGEAPMRALARALVGEVPSDPDTLRELLGFDDPDVAFRAVRRWRDRQAEALLVVDRFEELFTLSPSEVQARFAGLLGRLAAEGDVHVLLSLRDDFLIRCHEHAPLEPVFSNLTPILALGGDDLRRALVEPARQEGFAFEDEALVTELLESVAGERGALPLVAFAVARLWEKRDREKKLLTRRAYEEVGGVAGALAGHAERTLERIGRQREPIVRELFRNLVTAQGTRAAADREELLSALPDREVGARVLAQLVDARLLTSYEVRESEAADSSLPPVEPGPRSDEGTGRGRRHRIEIVHESLLRAWPRLVRWQAQDEEGTVLRDQLKQAARLWDEKGRSPDLLWSGTTFREFELWRGRYSGRLTALEEDFARSMAARARRRKRLQTTTLVSVIVVLAFVAVAIGASRQEALESARRAEASKLVALAQVRLREDPTEALALATASLELADTREARIAAARALWEAPPAREIEVPAGPWTAGQLTFSPDGRWLAAGGHSTEVQVWGRDGLGPIRLEGHERADFLRRGNRYEANWSSNRVLVTGLFLGPSRRVWVWSLPEAHLERAIEFEDDAWFQVGPRRLFVTTPKGLTKDGSPQTLLLHSWELPDGDREPLGEVDWQALGASASFLEPHGRAWLYSKGRTTYMRPLPFSEERPDETLARHAGQVRYWVVHPSDPERAFSKDAAGEIQLWSFESWPPVRIRSLPEPEGAPEWVVPDPSGRWSAGVVGAQALLWAAGAWPEARPLRLRRSGSWAGVPGPVFDAGGDWLAAATRSASRVTIWPTGRRRAVVVDGVEGDLALAFSHDSRWLAASWPDGVRLWPLPGVGHGVPRTLDLPEPPVPMDMEFAPDDRYLFGAGFTPPFLAPTDGSPGRFLEVPSTDRNMFGVSVSPSGRRVATATLYGTGPERIFAWDLETGRQWLYDLPKAPLGDEDMAERSTWSESRGHVFSLHFTDEETLYTAGAGGVRRWDIEKGTHVLVLPTDPGGRANMEVGPDGRTGLLNVVGLADRQQCEEFGVVDHTLRLWPMPDLDEPPLHTLPHEEPVAKLRSLTNLRAVRDPDSSTDWTFTLAPFPGWKDVPTW